MTAGTMTNTLRLTGAVAYNAFKTTPVITQVGGPVSRIMVVPGRSCAKNQPMLEVSSPDYAQLLDGYLKAADSFGWRTSITRAQDLYEHHAIAQQDLEQAESNRTPGAGGLNAAEQGMRILGIKNPEDLAKAPVGADSCAGPDLPARWWSGWFRQGRWCRQGRRRHSPSRT
jgi:cobalt-zinc-cadmium efflux system membrane fusion protein